MKIFEIIEDLIKNVQLHETVSNTCDTLKAGSADKEITGVGLAMFATPDVLREAASQNINFLIVHEPIFYNHTDAEIPYSIGYEKKKLIDDLGITVFRFHDYAHSMKPDLIYEGQTKYMGIPGKCESGNRFGINRFVLDEAMTATELARRLEKNLGIQHIRIAGCPDKKGRYISCCFGTPGHIKEELAETDFVLTGEVCEWIDCEVARDYAQLGYNKAFLIMGHIGSERGGMKLLAEKLSEKYDRLNVRYIECGEAYSYTDSPID